jgi:hypothetical protein
MGKNRQRERQGVMAMCRSLTARANYWRKFSGACPNRCDRLLHCICLLLAQSGHPVLVQPVQAFNENQLCQRQRTCFLFLYVTGPLSGHPLLTPCRCRQERRPETKNRRSISGSAKCDRRAFRSNTQTLRAQPTQHRIEHNASC